MAKKTISRLSVLAVLIVFLAACSKTSEYTNVIPADASVVASINLKSLASKAGLDDKENEAAKQKVLEALKSGMNAATFQQLEKVMKNPGESGIDVESPFYVFSSSSFPYPTVVGKVNNEDNLHASLDVMAKEQICQPISEADGYSFTTMNGGLLAFNNSTVLIVNVSGTTQTEKAKEAITNLLKQTADNSIVKSGAFQKMEKQKSDINFLASMEAIPATYRNQISMGLPTEVKAEDITLVGGLNFEKGKIALKTENYTENEAVKALIKKQMESFGKANNTFVKYFPSSTLMFFNVGVKGEGLYNLLSENKEFRNTVSIAKADEVKELFGSFNGDISAGLINVTMNSAPTFMMYADVKNGNALETIYKNKQSLGLKRGEDIIQLGKDEYVYKTKGMNIFFGIKDKQMYATNDELLYKNVGKAADQEMMDAVRTLTTEHPANVFYCKRLSRDEIKNLMEQCTCLVCASRDDPMPTFVTEGLIFGKPSIVSEHTGTAGLITEGVDGFTYPDDDPEKLSSILEWAILHPEKLAAMRADCRRLYEKHYSKQSFADTLTAAVKELTEQH
jgi:glycosyltransferase involved in cell wall biosynthesis